jgi:glycosyltransferase involved in cell wall biosynthesis
VNEVASAARINVKRRLKIGVLASHAIQYQAPLFRELRQHCDLMVFFAHQQTPEGQAQEGFGVQFAWDVDLLAGYRHHQLQNVARYPSVSRFRGCDTPDIANQIRKEQFDAVVVMGWNLKCYWQAVLACRRIGMPVLVRGDSQLVTPRGFMRRVLKRLLYPLLLRCFDGHLYVGQRNREYLRHYGVPENRLFFAPHCVDNDFYRGLAAKADTDAFRRRLNLNPTTRVLLFVGKLLAIKGPDQLISAVGTTDLRNDCCVVFAGDGPLRDQLATLAEGLGVQTRFLGFTNQSDLPMVYAAADVLALPSRSETWGLVCNEALACGTPIVVSDAAGCAPDLVVKGITGESHQLCDLASFAAAIQRALRIPRGGDCMLQHIQRYSVTATSMGIVRATEQLARTNENDAF